MKSIESSGAPTGAPLDHNLRSVVPLIQVRDLRKTFGRTVHALQGVDLDIRRGEGVILLGHNGSGKSTLLRCLNRLEDPTSGSILFNGEDIIRARPRVLRDVRRRIGFVFQRFNLVGNLTAFQNVLFGALGRHGYIPSLSMFASRGTRLEAMEALDRVGLADQARQRADQLSGGQQQRVAIARALVQKPEVILADEPIASLDPRAARAVMDCLWDVGREHQFTIICTLHQLEIALDLGERIVALKEGRKVMDANGAGLAKHDLAWLYEEEPDVEEDFRPNGALDLKLAVN